MKRFADELYEKTQMELEEHGGHYVSYTDLRTGKEVEVDGLTHKQMVRLQGKIRLDNYKVLQSCM